MLLSGSLSDLGDRHEPSGRAMTVFPDFSLHSEPMQREIGEKWTAIPTGAVDQPQVQQAPDYMMATLGLVENQHSTVYQ